MFAREASRGAAAAALALLVVCLGVAVGAGAQDVRAAAANGTPSARDFAYGVFLSKQGKWIGPKTPSGTRDLSLIGDLIDADPRYLRLTTASNDCPYPLTEPRHCKTAVPRQTLTRTARFQRLLDSGIRLGVGINATYVSQRHEEPTRSVREVIQHACQVNLADTEDVYDFIFLDFALRRRNPEELQRIVDGIRSGDTCPPGAEEGWRLVMTSDTTFRSDAATESSRRTWAHGKRFELLEGSGWRDRVAKAVRGERSALVREDRRFIEYIRRRDPQSNPMLELEVAHQTTRFSRLRGRVQRVLLRKWAKAQVDYRFDMIYPLYVHGHGEGLRDYDSRDEGTYNLLTDLMCRYGGAPGDGC